jgi:leucyl aminopeptidase
VLADVLSNLRERVLCDPAAHPKPTFLSIATLTGHAVRCFGGYATAIDNMAAKAAGVTINLPLLLTKPTN